MQLTLPKLPLLLLVMLMFGVGVCFSYSWPPMCFSYNWAPSPASVFFLPSSSCNLWLAVFSSAFVLDCQFRIPMWPASTMSASPSSLAGLYKEQRGCHSLLLQ